MSVDSSIFSPTCERGLEQETSAHGAAVEACAQSDSWSPPISDTHVSKILHFLGQEIFLRCLALSTGLELTFMGGYVASGGNK